MSTESVGALGSTEAQTETLLNPDAGVAEPTSSHTQGEGLETAPRHLRCFVYGFTFMATLAIVSAALATQRSRAAEEQASLRTPEEQASLRALQAHHQEVPCRLLLTDHNMSSDTGSSGFLGMVMGVLNAIHLKLPETGSTECTPLGAPGGTGCSAWGENCVNVGCCIEDGHQCFRKNLTYGRCLPDCVPHAPNMFEEDSPAKWTCGPVGLPSSGQAKVRVVERVPRWVHTSCAKKGFDCSASRCCAEPGQQCYERAEGFGQCFSNCTAGPHRFEGSTHNWTCSVLGPGPPGKKEENSKKASQICSKEGDDCGGSTCCAAPGAQCYVKNSSFAECLVTCPPAPNFSKRSHGQFDHWSCARIGQRTPGEAAAVSPRNASLRFEDLPGWVKTRCSKKTQNCASTLCCRDPELQCYEREAGKAFCRRHCVKGMVEDKHTWDCNELGPRTPVECPKCVAKRSAPPTVVIPFFERDLCKLKYTAKSISVNDPHHFLGDVLLMWVSHKRILEFQDKIDPILAILRESRNATVVDFTDRIKLKGLSGWHAQQIAKLKVASAVQTDYYIVMDSKNTLIVPLKEDPFFTPCGQGLIQAEFTVENMMMPHTDWYGRSAVALGLPSPKDSDAKLLWPSSITPMVMHSQSVLDMLGKLGEATDIEHLCDGTLCGHIGAFSKDGKGATEFTLYALYVYSLFESDTFKCIHAIDPVLGFKISYGKKWFSELQSKILEAGLAVEPSQMVVSNKDGWPLDWSPDDGDAHSSPAKEEWPLSFTDSTRKWSGAIWRGMPADRNKLVHENLRTLSQILNGSKMSPIMFGAQPASLAAMKDDQKDEAIDNIVKLYDQTHLLDAEEKDFIGCVVGYVN